MSAESAPRRPPTKSTSIEAEPHLRAGARPPTSPPMMLLALQRAAGNAAAARAVASLRQPRARTADLARVIAYSTESKLLPAKDRFELEQALVRRYGEKHREMIVKEIDKLSRRPGTWTMAQVHGAFEALKLPRYTDVNLKSSSSKSKPSLPGSHDRKTDHPEYVRAVKDFSWNQHTTLHAEITLPGSETYEHDETSRSANKDTGAEGSHAEPQLMTWLEGLGDLSKDPQIVITINNSPCPECAPELVKWVKKHKLTNVTVWFANPFGQSKKQKQKKGGAKEKTTKKKSSSKKAEAEAREKHGRWQAFQQSIQLLKGAGIHVHGFSPLDLIGSDTDEELNDRERKNFEGFRTRLAEAKSEGWYESSSEAEDDKPPRSPPAVPAPEPVGEEPVAPDDEAKAEPPQRHSRRLRGEPAELRGLP